MNKIIKRRIHNNIYFYIYIGKNEKRLIFGKLDFRFILEVTRNLSKIVKYYETCILSPSISFALCLTLLFVLFVCFFLRE